MQVQRIINPFKCRDIRDSYFSYVPVVSVPKPSPKHRVVAMARALPTGAHKVQGIQDDIQIKC